MKGRKRRDGRYRLEAERGWEETVKNVDGCGRRNGREAERKR